jgi:3-oxoadipate enol-lactonase
VASAPEFQLAVREAGTGPAVLLLHGAFMDRTLWDPVLPGLAERFRGMAPDLRGHGASAAPPTSTFGFPEFEQDLIDLLDRGHVERAHLVGFSAGAFLALALALHRPERVRSLALVSGAAHAGPQMRNVTEEWRRVREEQGLDAFALRLVKDVYFTDYTDEHLDVVDVVRSHLAAVPFHGPQRWMQTVLGFDGRGRIGAIRRPTWIAHGMNDVVVDASQARYLRQSIPGSELKLFPRTGHMVPIERTAEFTSGLLDFLVRVESGAPAAPSNGIK